MLTRNNHSNQEWMISVIYFSHLIIVNIVTKPVEAVRIGNILKTK
jgi:hypothetical protein